jgi:hypothetical protein
MVRPNVPNLNMITEVSHHELTADELTELIARFPLERSGTRTLEEITEAQVQQLFGRLEALTRLLRGTSSNETTRLASRMLLHDLTAVAAHFRGRSNVLGTSLASARTQLGEALAACDAAEARSSGTRDESPA